MDAADLHVYVAAVKAKIPQALNLAFTEASAWAAVERDKLGCLDEALAEAHVAAEENDLRAYADAMLVIAGIAITELAAAETPGTVLNV